MREKRTFIVRGIIAGDAVLEEVHHERDAVLDAAERFLYSKAVVEICEVFTTEYTWVQVSMDGLSDRAIPFFFGEE